MDENEKLQKRGVLREKKSWLPTNTGDGVVGSLKRALKVSKR